MCHDVDLAARLQRSVERLLDRLMGASRQIQDARQLETDLQQSLEQATRNVDELTVRCDDLEQQLRQETQTREFLSVEFYKADGMIFHYNLTTIVTAYNGSRTLASKQSSYSVVKQEDVTVFLNNNKKNFCKNYGCDGASQYPHPDADFMSKIRRIRIWMRMRMRICRAIKITSYYGYCNST